MATLNNNTLDNGLTALKAAASHIYITSQEATTFLEATSTYALGNKNFGAGAVYPGAIAAGTPSGRKLSSAPITDGSVTANGTATHYAVTSSAASQLEVTNNLVASQVVTNLNTFTLTAADVRLPNVGG